MAMSAESTGAQSGACEKRHCSAPNRNGYVKTCVVPQRRDRGYGAWVKQMFTKLWSSQSVRSALCVGSLSVVSALLLRCAEWRAESSSSSSSSSGSSSALPLPSFPLHSGCAAELLQTCWSVFSPLFTLVCAFFWLGVYLIHCGVLVQTALSLLTLCHLGEVAACSLLDGTDAQLFSVTTAAALVLICVAACALMVVRMNQGISVIVFINLIRTLSLLSLHKVRASWRPYAAYLVGVLGILLARYADKLLPKQGTHKEGCTPVTGAREEIPVFKRRRRSSSVIASDMAHSHSNSKPHRRTSLPCIQRDQMLSRSDWEHKRGPRGSQKSTPVSVQKSTPVSVQKSTPVPVQKSTPVPVQKSTPVPVQKSTPVPVQKSTPATPVPVQKSTPQQITKRCILKGLSPSLSNLMFFIDYLLHPPLNKQQSDLCKCC